MFRHLESRHNGGEYLLPLSPPIHSLIRKSRPQMIPEPELRLLVAVRDGRAAPVTCSECGCRLQAVGHPGAEAWFHFNPLAGRDARGCRVGCADQAHDAAGRAAVAIA
jgi:hypothetical protein